METKFLGLEYVPGTTSVVRGVKRGKRPSGAVYGGNGSYRCVKKPQVNLSVLLPTGKIYEQDVYDQVRPDSDKRVTEKYVERLEKKITKQEMNIEILPNAKEKNRIPDFREQLGDLIE